MPRTLWVVVIPLTLLACREQEVPIFRGDSPLVDSFARAAERFRVPQDLLMAVAYVESRFSQRSGEPSRLEGYGLMHLRAGSTLEEAARLTGRAAASLQLDGEANIEGGAAVLAARAASSGIDLADLPAWGAVLAEVSHLPEAGAASYAAQVLDVLRRGVSGEDETGRSLVVPPHPELGATDALPEGIGRAQSALTPDYSGAQWKGPACCSSSRTTSVSFVIIHTCQGGFAGCWSWLKGCHDVSAHYVVSSGGDVVQLVEEKLKAWHVGCLNSQSVGIEHEGYVSDPGKWFTEDMYCASAKLVKSICNRHNFPCDRKHVIGHNEANASYCHGDHTDPGSGWNWTKFMGYVQNGCGGPPPPPPAPQMTIKVEVSSIKDQDRDFCVDGESKGIFDWREEQETEALVDVKNTGDAVAKSVEVGLWGEEPYLKITRWEILSDWKQSGGFVINDTDGLQKTPRDNPGQTFKLAVGSISPTETKRVRLRIRAAQGSLALVDHPDVRAWVAKVEGVYDKASFDAKPQNVGGTQKQNGGDLRAYFQTDVIGSEICGDGKDNDCDGNVDNGCDDVPPAPSPDGGSLAVPPLAPSTTPRADEGCSAAGAPRSAALALLVLAPLLLLGWRRRRRQSTCQDQAPVDVDPR